ncbi:MAG: hypothetical protein LBT40_08145 [Deltaproteobacteria bacterium]|jgi:hypothetical protein|nr:hypothetical protein [Deltaproteobacteria bacterium]
MIQFSFPVRSLVALAISAVLAVLAAGPLSAQDGPPEEIFQNQPPFSVSDVPPAMEFISAQANGSLNRDALIALAARHNITVERLFFASGKMMCGMLLLAPDSARSRDQVAQQIGTPLALPDDAELAVIRSALESGG